MSELLIREVQKMWKVSTAPVRAGSTQEVVWYACRRSGELEVKRIQRRLEVLETTYSAQKRHKDTGYRDFASGLTHKEMLRALSSEVAEAEKRLLEILQAQEA